MTETTPLITESIHPPPYEETLSKWRRFLNLRHYVTVEPTMFVFHMAQSIVSPTNSALFYEKSCLQLHSQKICSNIHQPQYRKEEDATQGLASQWEFYESVTYEPVALLATIFYGSMSDRYSRKLPLLLPTIGYVLYTVMFLINAIFITLPMPVMLVGPFLAAIFGGATGILMAAFSYLTEVSTHDNRTVRIAIVYALNSLTSFVGSLLSGVLLDKTGFRFVYSLGVGTYALSSILVIFGVREIHRNIPEKDGNPAKTSVCRNFCNELIQLKQTAVSVVKKRPNNARLHIILCLLIVFCFSAFSSAKVNYLFLR